MSWNAFTALVRRDLRLFFLDKRALTMSFVAPIVIGSFFGYLFGGAADRAPSKIQIAVVDQDGTAVSRKIVDAISKDPTIEVQPPLSLGDVEARVRGGKTTVAAVIPKGFADTAGQAFFRGENKPEIRLLYDPSHGTELAMIRGILTQHVMEIVSSESISGESSGKLVDEALRDVQSSGGMNPADRKALVDMLKGVGEWNQRVRNSPDAAAGNRGGFNMPYTVKQEAITANKNGQYNSMAHSFAGMSVQFILFMGIDAGMIVLMQRRTGMWKRLQAAPLSRWTVIASRAASATINSMVILTVVFTFARIVWGVKIEGSLAGFAGVCLAFSIMTAAFGLLIAVLGRTPEAARGISILVTLVLVMLGGSWVPAFLFPPWLQKIGFLIPTRWAVDGLDGTIWRGFSFDAALAPIGALMIFAALFGLVAVWRFKWES